LVKSSPIRYTLKGWPFCMAIEMDLKKILKNKICYKIYEIFYLNKAYVNIVDEK
jgi:hypothetical protein